MTSERRGEPQSAGCSAVHNQTPPTSDVEGLAKEALFCERAHRDVGGVATADVIRRLSSTLQQLAGENESILAEAFEWRDKALAAEALVKEAGEVLRPFAEAAVDLDDDHPDQTTIWECAAAMGVTGGNLRRARSLLQRLEADKPAQPKDQSHD